MSLTLKIENATLIDFDTHQTIGIENGLVTEVSSVISAPAAETIDANSSLVIPGLVDPHLHLDKALFLSQRPAKKGTFQETL